MSPRRLSLPLLPTARLPAAGRFRGVRPTGPFRRVATKTDIAQGETYGE